MLSFITNIIQCIDVETFNNFIICSNAHYIPTRYKIHTDQEEWHLCNNVLIMPQFLKNRTIDDGYEMFLLEFSANEVEPIEHKIDISSLQMLMFAESFRKKKISEYLNEKNTIVGFHDETFTLNDIVGLEETYEENQCARSSTLCEQNYQVDKKDMIF